MAIFKKQSKAKLRSAHIQEIVDESVEESFPASDVPAWTAEKRYHKKLATTGVLKDKVGVKWQRTTTDFEYESYNRDATLIFGGGEKLIVSNPAEYFGNANCANSEELFIAAVSCCYMQTFLAVASKLGYNVKQYADEAIGTLGKDESGKMGITEICLNPKIKFEGIQPSKGVLLKLQEKAEDNCFIANSVCSNIKISIEKI